MERSKAGQNTSKAYWSMPHEELFHLLESKADGLSMLDAETRLQNLGLNKLRDKQAYSALRLLLGQFRDPLMLILISRFVYR